MNVCVHGQCSDRVFLCQNNESEGIIYYFMEVLTISKNKDLLINEDIREKEVRLIDVEGEQIGVVPIDEALRLARDKNLDLVKIAPQANPPVCRIMDYGKYLFEQSKRDREARKNQRVIQTKEVRMSVAIDTHDFDVKVRNAIRFLKSGDKVKVSIRFRGREMAHPEIGRELMTEFIEACKEHGELANRPVMEGRSLTAVLNPNF